MTQFLRAALNDAGGAGITLNIGDHSPISCNLKQMVAVVFPSER